MSAAPVSELPRHEKKPVTLTEREIVAGLAMILFELESSFELWEAVKEILAPYKQLPVATQPDGSSRIVLDISKVPETRHAIDLTVWGRNALETILGRQGQHPEAWKLSLAALRRME